MTLVHGNEYLMHHGVKGQKWGVRRYQNYDGTLTEEGKRERTRVRRLNYQDKTGSIVNGIANTWNQHDRSLMGLEEKQPYQLDDVNDEWPVVKRVITKSKNIPVSFFDIEHGKDELFVSVGTRSGDEYRGKGYAQRSVKKGMSWYDKHKDEFKDLPVYWLARSDNAASNRLAVSNGFVDTGKRDTYDNHEWNLYKYQSK